MSRVTELDPLMRALTRYSVQVTASGLQGPQARVLFKVPKPHIVDFEQGMLSIWFFCKKNGLACDFSRMYFKVPREGASSDDLMQLEEHQTRGIYSFRLLLDVKSFQHVEALAGIIRRAPVSPARQSSEETALVDSRFPNTLKNGKGVVGKGGSPAPILLGMHR